jgi:sortase A
MRHARTTLETFAWIAGSVLLASYLAARMWSAQAYAAGVAEMRAQMQRAESQVAESDAAAHRPTDQSLWSRERVIAYEVAQKAGGRPEALLRIPSISLEVPVYDSVSEINLNRGAGLIDGVLPLIQGGNAGIAAHRDGYFRALKDLAVDGELYLDFRGNTKRYRIVDLRIVAPEDNSVLAPSRVPTVTLVTCYPFYFVGSAPQRFIVRAELDDAGKSNSSRNRELLQVSNWRNP